MIKLYLDEDVPEAIAMALRLRGYDVLTVREASKKGLADVEQLRYAFLEKRIMFTHKRQLQKYFFVVLQAHYERKK